MLSVLSRRFAAVLVAITTSTPVSASLSVVGAPLPFGASNPFGDLDFFSVQSEGQRWMLRLGIEESDLKALRTQTAQAKNPKQAFSLFRDFLNKMHGKVRRAFLTMQQKLLPIASNLAGRFGLDSLAAVFIAIVQRLLEEVVKTNGKFMGAAKNPLQGLQSLDPWTFLREALSNSPLPDIKQFVERGKSGLRK